MNANGDSSFLMICGACVIIRGEPMPAFPSVMTRHLFYAENCLAHCAKLGG